MPGAFVAERAAATVNDAGATSDVVSVSGITPGNTLILTAYQNGASGPVISSVTDNAGNIWTVDQTKLVNTNTSSVSIASGYCSGAPTQITINYTSSGTTRYWMIEEFSGLASVSRRDATGNVAITTAATPQSVTSGPVAGIDQVAVAALVIATNTEVISAPFSAFTTPRIQNGAVVYNMCPGYLVLTATGTQTATWTWVAASNIAAVIVTYKTSAVPARGTSRVPLGV